MLSVTQLQKFAEAAAARRTETPYMLTNTSMVREKCREFRKNFPDVRLFYALKCFGDAEVVQAINDLVDGYDVASIQEIEHLLALGVAPGSMAFSNPVKSNDAIKRASFLNIRQFAFQSKNELVKIAHHAPGSSVYVRVKMQDSRGSIALSSKFGCLPKDAVELLLYAKRLGLVPIGLTFHVGSQAVDLHAWTAALDTTKKIIEQAERHDLSLRLINLGGGFPAQYSEQDLAINELATILNGILSTMPEGLEYMAEPGRYLVADSSVVVASVIGVEERMDKTWLFLDVGAFQAFSEVFEFHSFPYPVYSVKHIVNGVTPKTYRDYILTGPTCDAHDTLTDKISLPSDIAVGDRLLITMAGAYTVAQGSNFNGFPIPPRHFIGVASHHKAKKRAVSV